MDVGDLVYAFNAFAWITSNILVGYISVILIIFVAFYYIAFDPRATTAGKFIFRFVVSLVGVIGLIFVGLFLDPVVGREWFQFPGDVLWWRPAVRLIVFGYVSYAVTALVVVLVLRKFWPEKLRTSEEGLVKVRSEKTEERLIP